MVNLLQNRAAPAFLKVFCGEKIVDVAKVNQRCCSEKSKQQLENVDQTHLVLASGKLVPHKISATGKQGEKSRRDSNSDA